MCRQRSNSDIRCSFQQRHQMLVSTATSVARFNSDIRFSFQQRHHVLVSTATSGARFNSDIRFSLHARSKCTMNDWLKARKRLFVEETACCRGDAVVAEMACCREDGLLWRKRPVVASPHAKALDNVIWRQKTERQWSSHDKWQCLQSWTLAAAHYWLLTFPDGNAGCRPMLFSKLVRWRYNDSTKVCSSALKGLDISMHAMQVIS